MQFKLDDTKVPDKTVLMVALDYEGQTTDKVWTYVLLKAGGRWYSTGNGRTLQDAGWGAVAKWLASDGRRVLWVRHMKPGSVIFDDSSS